MSLRVENSIARRRTQLAAVGVTLCATLACAPGARAVRYASSTGKSTSNCQTQATACDLMTAVHGVGGNEPVKGEEVIVEPGEYSVSSGPLEPGASEMDVHGAAGMPRPVITGHASEVFYGSNGLTLDYLDIEEQGTTEALGLSGATLERLLLRGKPSGNVLCQCYDGTLRNSVLVALAGSSSGAMGLHSNGGTDKETLRGDTIYSESAAAPAIELEQMGASGELELSVYNTIAVNAAGGHDVSATAHGKIVMTHSDYASPTGAGTITDGGARVTAPPLFVNAAAGDFRELVGSPTIDAGVTEAEDGALDFEGNPRAAGTASDIGALEYQPPPVPIPVTTGQTTTTSTQGALIGKVLPPTPPQLKLAVNKVAINAKTGVGKILATCQAPAQASCKVSGFILAAKALVSAGGEILRHHPKRVTIGVLSGALTAGASAALTVKLTPSALRALRRRHSLLATLSATLSDGTLQRPLAGALQLRLAPAAHRHR